MKLFALRKVVLKKKKKKALAFCEKTTMPDKEINYLY